ncbi:MAG: hypothetical protein JWO43_118 [Candidatus Adlerbacteria bacterium]|nr:hypothetical protein [Candidatus Adlerbacteria bacterium]
MNFARKIVAHVRNRLAYALFGKEISSIKEGLSVYADDKLVFDGAIHSMVHNLAEITAHPFGLETEFKGHMAQRNKKKFMTTKATDRDGQEDAFRQFMYYFFHSRGTCQPDLRLRTVHVRAELPTEHRVYIEVMCYHGIFLFPAGNDYTPRGKYHLRRMKSLLTVFSVADKTPIEEAFVSSRQVLATSQTILAII